MKKKGVLFIGSFKETSKDGGVGGQMYACKTIINSSISDFVEWTLIDTTADSNILSSNFNRILKASNRLIKFLYYVIFNKYDSILIFTADGWSFWEKGLISIIGSVFSKGKIIIAPRSGFILNDINKNVYLGNFIKYVFHKVDFVICQSNEWKMVFEKHIGKVDNSKFVIIENMIEFDRYKNFKIRNLQVEDKVNILFMAWVTKSKGIFELLEAVKMLKYDDLNFNLIIAGKGDAYKAVSEFVQKHDLHDYISLEGWVLGEAKMKLLEKSDLFVLPTYFEGYPNSLMEAMASGKACIATLVGSIPDMIDNYKSGVLIEKENYLQLYQSLKYLIENSIVRHEISKEARKKIKNTNNMNIGISKFKEILK